MKIVDRLKHWVGIDQFEDALLLNRYGARSIDELYSMIMMGRTAEPTSFVKMETWRLTTVNRIATQIMLYKRHGLRPQRKISEEAAKEFYKSRVKEANSMTYRTRWMTAPTGPSSLFK